MRTKKATHLAAWLLCLSLMFLCACALAACGDDGEEGGAEIVSLTVTQEPDRTSYIEGQFFDASGAVLTAAYSDGSETEIDGEDCSYSPSGALSASDTEVTFTYSGLTAAQPVSVCEASAMEMSGARMIVTGYEWGPAVNAFIVDFGEEVSGVTADMFDVQGVVTATSYGTTTTYADRTVTDLYLCDEDGNETDGPSRFMRAEMTVRYNFSSPYSYNMQTGYNTWNTYGMVLFLTEGSGILGYEGACRWEHTFTRDEWILPDLEGFETGSYASSEGIELNWALFTPDGAEDDGGENPLIVWLHGYSEGGTDITCALLGNETVALARDGIQSYFTGDGLAGAYVLAVQTPTSWWDRDGTNTASYVSGEYTWAGQPSYYTDALMETIEYVVDGCGDIDTDRIYLGGCSNGGYMTMNMMFEHGEYFAAFFPVAEAYASGNISDTMIERVKDYEIWFLTSEDDTTVDAKECTLPTYYRILQAGGENVHLTLCNEVIGTDDPGRVYSTHASAIYLLNDQVNTEVDIALTKADSVTIDSETGKLTGKGYSALAANCTVSCDFYSWLCGRQKG